MILDRGVATFYHKQNTAAQGAKPVFQPVQFYRSWYGELNFETSPANPTERREQVQTDARIRVIQNRQINNHDQVTLGGGDATRYEITRAYHGRDDDSGALITDCSLVVIEP